MMTQEETAARIAFVMRVLDAVDWIRPRVGPAQLAGEEAWMRMSQESYEKFGAEISVVAIGVIVEHAKRDLEVGREMVNREWAAMHAALGQDKPE